MRKSAVQDKAGTTFVNFDNIVNYVNYVIRIISPEKLFPCSSVRSVVTTPLPCGVLAAKRLITFWREDGKGSVRPHKKKESSK